MAARIVYVNGDYLPEAEGKVSIFDRGFLFADGVYEVTAVVGGKLIDYAPHMERLERSLREIAMAWPCTKSELRTVHEELIRRNAVKQGWVYMQITRGVADRDFKFPKSVGSSLVAFTQVKDIVDNPDATTGVKVISVPDVRWARRDIKSVMLLAPVLGKQAAYEAGAFEAWMIEDGHVTEGTSSNAYIVKDGRVITCPLSNRILAGITRRSLFRLAAESGVVIEERRFTLNEAYEADEAFLTSASNFVLPIVEIDGNRIGGGQPGPVARKLRSLFIAMAKDAD
ncbi:MAG TPA: D-amino-acid transaminase [Aestuariivirgaceae bacterium]|nr:D-amino-acid transaminase [Aestuariivirgaceae bacterium]